MKKIISVCLLTVLVCCSIIVVNIFQTKDKIRINDIESSENSFHFYIKNSNISLNEELSFFQSLSKNEKVTFFRTDKKNNTLVKSTIFEKNSFPYEQFGLKRKNLFRDEKNFYSSYNTKDRNQQGEIPVFSKSNKIILQSMKQTYKNTGLSTNGIYTVSLADINSKEEVLKQLSNFFGISQKDLTNSNSEEVFGFVNQILILTIILMISSILVLIIITVYGPLTEVKKFGIMKLQGYSNVDIFIDHIKINLFLIAIMSAIIDIFVFICFEYKPQHFLLSIILTQIAVEILYLVTTISAFFTIRKVTIGKLLKNFLNFRYGVITCYILKGLISIVITLILIILSTNIKMLFSQQKINAEWEKYGNNLTLDYLTTTGKSQLDFEMGNIKNSESAASLFQKFEIQNNAYYINSALINPIENLQLTEKDGYKVTDRYELMDVNMNYLKTLPIYKRVSNTILNSEKDNTRIFLVPESYKKKSNIRSLCQNILFAQFSSKEQENNKVSDESVQIMYYNDENTSLFTYNSTLSLEFTHPIIMVMNSKNMTFFEKMTLLKTGASSPIKINNTKENRIKIEQQQKGEDLYLKFSTVNSILGNTTSSFLDGIKVLAIILSGVVILNIFTSLFLMTCIMISEKEKISVYHLLGLSMWEKYKTHIIIFLGFYAIQFITCLIFGKSMLILPYIIIIMFIEIAIVLFIIHGKERRNLGEILKGG